MSTMGSGARPGAPIPFSIYYSAENVDEVGQEIERGITRVFEVRIRQAVYKGCLLVVADAKRLCPVDTGRLRSSIYYKVIVTKEMIEGEVGTNVFYARFIEFGTRPHGVSTKHYGIRQWARRNKVDLEKTGLWVGPPGQRKHFVPFDIAPGLKKWAEDHGVLERKAFWVTGKPKPFLYPALAKNQQRIYSLFEKAARGA